MEWIFSGHASCLVVGMVIGVMITNHNWRRKIDAMVKEGYEELAVNKKIRVQLLESIELLEKQLESIKPIVHKNTEHKQ